MENKNVKNKENEDEDAEEGCLIISRGDKTFLNY